jgi:FliI/YscN family ATPase
MRTHGEVVVAALPGARVGDGARIHGDGRVLLGEVAAVERARVTIAPFGSVVGIAVGDRVEVWDAALASPVGFRAIGRAFDAGGAPLDGRGEIAAIRARVERESGTQPGSRRAVDTPFWTGVRAVDGLLTIGRGARLGIFGAAAAGKTTLLEMIAAGAAGDAVVLALVGERGREAQTWFGRIDGRTTIVCATSDRSASERIRAADVAMAQARNLARAGLDVVLIVDSLARYATALRERHVSLGESVGRGGYPPSVWAALARFLERAGVVERGSITLIATVLTDGDDEREPLAEAARSLLDGHIVLSSALARAGQFPAIDVLSSSSRTMAAVARADHAGAARNVRAALALLAETKDARSLGLVRDAGAALSAAVAAEGALAAFFRQSESTRPTETLSSLFSLSELVEPLR